MDERGVHLVYVYCVCAEIDLREREREREREYMSLVKRKSVFHCPEPFDGARTHTHTHRVTYVSWSPPTPATPSVAVAQNTQKGNKQHTKKNSDSMVHCVRIPRESKRSNLSLSLSMLFS